MLADDCSSINHSSTRRKTPTPLRVPQIPLNVSTKIRSINVKAGGNASTHWTCAGTQKANNFSSATQTKTPVPWLLGQHVPQLSKAESLLHQLAQKMFSAALFSFKWALFIENVDETWKEKKTTCFIPQIQISASGTTTGQFHNSAAKTVFDIRTTKNWATFPEVKLDHTGL